MNPSYFIHRLLCFKKQIALKNLNFDTFLCLGSNWNKNTLYLPSSSFTERNMSNYRSSDNGDEKNIKSESNSKKNSLKQTSLGDQDALLSTDSSSQVVPQQQQPQSLTEFKKKTTMKAWQASRHGIQHLELSTVDIPSRLKPKEVIVKVCAASVNPHDIQMLDQTFGDWAFEFLSFLGDFRNILHRPRFPFIGGRDFVGEVVQVGSSVSDFEVNDKVWGVVMPQKQGSHAEYVVTSDFLISKKPESISDIEAASVPFAGMTAWSTMIYFLDLSPRICEGLPVGVIGASGGVGTFLTQLLSLWGAKVGAICKKDSFPLVESCGASEVFDCEDPNTLEFLISEQKFKIVIAASGRLDSPNWFYTLMEDSLRPTFVSLANHFMINLDDDGNLKTKKSLAGLIEENTEYIPPIRVKSGFFLPDIRGLQVLGKYIEEGKIRPIIDKVFKKEDLLSAYDHVKNGPRRGKTVIDFTS